MAITTMDGLLAGLKPPQPILKAAFTGQAAGQLHSAYYLAGLPGAATAPAGGLAGTARTATVSGQIPVPTAVGGQSVYLAGADFAQAANVGGVIVADRLWDNSGLVVTTTTAQTVNSVAWPARDATGTINGVAVEVALEVVTATTNGAPVTTITMSYTNQAGTAGQTATIASFPANAVAGTLVPFALAAGDTGVRSIQTITLGTSLVTGAVSAVAFRRLGMVPTATANVDNRLDVVQLGMPLVYDNSVPWPIYLLSGTAGGVVVGAINWAQG